MGNSKLIRLHEDMWIEIRLLSISIPSIIIEMDHYFGEKIYGGLIIEVENPRVEFCRALIG